MRDYKAIYNEWLNSDYFDEDTKRELISIRDDEEEIRERFYTDLEFGTAGLRGIIGAGTNRMKIYVVRRATQGLANYILKQGGADKGVAIAYGSVYGHTENAAAILANRLSEKGVRNIAMYDVSNTHPSVLVSEAFRCSHLVVASATYNNGIFTPMETMLMDLKAHNLQNRTVAVIENGSWAPQAGKLIRSCFEGMKNITVLDQGVTLKSSVKEEQREALEALADQLAADILG